MSFSHGSGLMFLRDSHNKLDFLVDSGASLSIVPFSSSQTPLGPKLLGANGASIPTWGFQTKTIKIGTKNFEHEFLLAKVAIPILGLDFFRKFQLSIHPLLVMSTIPKRKHKRSDIKANYRNETTTF